MNQKQYSITINGVTESISQINALLGKLNEIENRLKNINTSSLSSSSSKGTSTATASEAKQQQEVAQATRTTAEENQRNLEALVGINRQLAENTNLQKEAMEIADRILGSNSKLHELNEQYKRDLEQIKSDRKEIDALEKFNQISSQEALERRTALAQKEMEIKTARQQNLVVLRNEQKLLSAEEGSYEQISYTLSRLKEALKQVNAGNLSPEDFQKLAGAIDETDKKAKAMAASMGEFQRNVGNYPSAFEGIEGLKIKIGETEAEFGNAREAMRALRNAMTELALEGKTDTEQFHDYEEALKQIQMASIKVSDSIDRAKDASSGLHDVVEMFEGVASIGAVGQGMSNLFGIDDADVQKKIQQMTSLIGVMNGLQKISTQMATGTGIGPALKKMFEFVGESPVQMFKNIRDQIKALPGEVDAAAGSMQKMGSVMNGLKSVGSTLWKGLVAGLASAGLMLAIDAAISGFKALFDELKNVFSLEDDAERSMKAYNAAVQANNTELKNRIDLLEKMAQLEGKGTYDVEKEKVEATTKSLQQYSDVLAATLTQQNNAFAKKVQNVTGTELDLSNPKQSVQELNAEVERLNKEMANGKDVEYELQAASTALANKIMQEFLKIDKSSEEAVNGFNDMVEGLGGVQIAVAQLDGKGDYFSNIRQSLLDVIQKAAEARNAFISMRLAMSQADRTVADAITDAAVNAIEDKTVRAVAQLEVARQRAIDNAKKQAADSGKVSKEELDSWISDINKSYDRMEKEAAESDKKTSRSAASARKSRINEAQRTMRELEQIEKQIQLDRINAMRDGLTKSIELIRRERDERIKALEKFKGDKKYNTLVEETNALFDDKETRAREKFMDDYRKSMNEMKQINEDVTHSLNEMTNAFKTLNNEDVMEDALSSIDAQFISKELEDITDKYKAYGEQLEKIMELETMDKTLNRVGADPVFEKRIEEETKKLKELEEQIVGKTVRADIPKDTLHAWVEYYQERYTLQKMNYEQEKTLQLEAINEQYNYEVIGLKRRRQADMEAIDERYRLIIEDTEGLKELGKTQQEVMDEAEAKKLEVFEKYGKQIEYIEKRRTQAVLDINREFNQKDIDATTTKYERMLNELDKYSNGLMNTVSDIEKRNTNSWGIVDPIKMRKDRNATEEELKQFLEKYKRIMIMMRAISSIGLISPDDFKKFEEQIQETIKKIEEALNKLGQTSGFGSFIASMNTYIQELGNAMSSIFSSVYDYQSYLLDQEEDALDKENDMLEKKLSEQEEITRKHKEAMDDIEDELKTARGDRRDALIDQLNAEVAAQRASLAAEQRIKAQQEALKKKEDALDLKRKKQQQQQSKTQAIISSALAVANALATAPFIPTGLAMGALATAMGAVQVALIAKQKFAEGGSVEGPSHSRGGVQIEAEGGEYVINKKAYSRNAELVELINNAGRRLTLGDIANAGYDFPNAIETNGNNPIVVSSQEPIWVSVTDINRVQNRMATVKEMAE